MIFDNGLTHPGKGTKGDLAVLRYTRWEGRESRSGPR